MQRNCCRWIIGYFAALVFTLQVDSSLAWCPYQCDAGPCLNEQTCGWSGYVTGSYFGGWGCGFPNWCDFGDCYSLYTGYFGCDMACFENWGRFEVCTPILAV